MVNLSEITTGLPIDLAKAEMGCGPVTGNRKAKKWPHSRGVEGSQKRFLGKSVAVIITNSRPQD